MSVEPVFILKPEINTTRAKLVKNIMVVMALGFAAVGAFWPYLGIEGMDFVGICLFVVAVFDIMLAFALPKLMARQLSGLQYLFYEDRMEMRITFGGGQVISVPYSAVVDISEKPAIGGNHVTVYVKTDGNDITMNEKPYRLVRTMSLAEIPAHDMPVDRIKETIEKYKQSGDT